MTLNNPGNEELEIIEYILRLGSAGSGKKAKNKM